jgi:NADH-quinone oxidoreductase subunit J
LDLNQRPPGYEPDELPGCSTPQSPCQYSRKDHFVKFKMLSLTGYRAKNIMGQTKMLTVVFFILAACCLGSVLAMILSKNPSYAALWLVLAFASLGGLFGLLGAPFMAVVQVIIYAGAIMVLFVFLIMMVHPHAGAAVEKRKWPAVAGVLLGVVLAVELALAVRSALLSPAGEGIAVAPKDIGRLLLTKYLYPFEITSILIIAALVGSIALAQKRENS